MSQFKVFAQSGHWPTLFAAFLYFDFSCAIWVLNGAMAPFISETFGLTPAQKGLMLSVPIIAGALMRFPLGVLSQYIGRKNATLVEMGLIVVAMLFGFFFVEQLQRPARDGRAARASPAPASASRCRSARAGSRRSTRAWRWASSAPATSARCWRCCSRRRSRMWLGWQAVYGVAAVAIAAADARDVVFAKEPPDVDATPACASTSPACSRRTAGPSA